MQKITPFLWFDNQAEEAANFYVSVFKNASITSVSRYGEEGPGPAGAAMVVDFEIEGQRFLALNGGPMFQFSNAVSFMIRAETQLEIDYYWDRLTADGGKPGQCGWLTDKFGVPWQVVPPILGELLQDEDPERSGRVMKAMLGMGRIVVAELERAHGAADAYR